MRLVILRWLLKGGHSLEVILPEDEAKKLITLYQAGPNALSPNPRVGGYDKYQDRSWSLCLEEVQAVFYYDYETFLKAASTKNVPPATQNWGLQSGRN